MTAKFENQYGSVTIDNNVIATIAGTSAMECYGLVGMASKNATDGIVYKLKREHLTKGVKVTVVEDKIKVDLFVIFQYGTNITTVANNIIDKVKYNIETISGMNVEKVTINVQDIRVQK